MGNQKNFSGISPESSGKNCIKNYRRIENWENFFLDSAVYSVLNSLGIEYENGWTPISAITGDLFTYLYSDSAPCDSGLTNYVVMPEVVINVFDSVEYDCEYLSREQINSDMPSTLKKIYASIDRGVPVLAWGVGGVVFNEGNCFDPLPEGSLIGGYDGELLLVNLYPGAERLSEVSYGGRPGVDVYGYTAIPAEKTLATTYGVYIVNNKRSQQPEVSDVYRNAIMSIPKWLTLQPEKDWVFGRKAFDRWADVVSDSTDWIEDEIWNKHCSAYCNVCTSSGGESRVVDYLVRAAAACPDLTVISNIIPLYRRMNFLVQKIWEIHGGFTPDTDKMSNRAYRIDISNVLKEMGECCDNILNTFKTN